MATIATTPSVAGQKGFSTRKAFDFFHGKNIQHGANVRGRVNEAYNRLLDTKQLRAFQISGGNDLERLGMDKNTLIARPDLYYQAFNNILGEFKDKSPFPWPITTKTFFIPLHRENEEHSANVRGLINQKYNQYQLLESNQCHSLLIPGNNIEALGMNKTTPILRVDLYFQAYGDILKSFEIKNASTQVVSKNLVIYSFDVGGTKIAYSIGNEFETFKKGELNSSKGLPALIKNVETVFTSTVIAGRERVISIATPGKIENGVMSSALLLEATDNHGNTQHEFTNLHLQKSISQVIPNTKILHSNDAVAQFVGAVDILNKNGNLNGKSVAYLGIGSGFGGGLGHINASGNLSRHSDGEVWDIRLKLDGKDIPAYSILGGFPFKDTTGATPKEVNANAGLLSKHTPHIKKMGRALAAVAVAIYRGQVKKEDPRNDWSETQLKQIRGTSHFLIGGSIGTKGEISKIILEAARNEIHTAGLEGAIAFIQIPDAADSALRGCQVLMEGALRTNSDALKSFEVKNASTQVVSKNLVIYSFDVGGTKIAYSIGNEFETFKKDELASSKGLPALIEAVRTVFTNTVIAGRERVISIATPGKIENGVMSSARSLEATDKHGNTQHEFNNLHLQKSISQVIPNTKVLHSNNAIARFVGAVDILNKNGNLNGKSVAYLGIGSGFGGGLGHIDASGNLSHHPDGEVWDIHFDLDGRRISAYSILGAVPFKNATGITPEEVSANAELLSKHTPHIKKMGRALAAVAVAIYRGQVKKEDPRNDWSETQLKQVRGTSHFLIDGSIGTKGEISKIILEAAQNEIRSAGLEGAIVLVQIPDAADSALKGCQVLMKEALRTKEW